mmetsp:Transcript_10491/g.23524  ORF Transcript_10491/g.23524 Transcript_10491/m.23524 type:complete len:1240 (+) Transcript_10491:314-4033(+)
MTSTIIVRVQGHALVVLLLALASVVQRTASEPFVPALRRTIHNNKNLPNDDTAQQTTGASVNARRKTESVHWAWWNKIQARRHQGYKPHEYSNDGDCYMGLTMLGAPCTPRPTPFPTSPPSGKPSPSPTEAPVTNAPSPNPTPSPVTSAPTTAQPSFVPTLSPVTSKPTTAEPSAVPTSIPSKSPTASPVSASPTFLPTTAQPSYVPTLSPVTSKPTTAEPSAVPTSIPSKSPTASPVSASPTFVPTARPSPVPSISASASPSVSPTTARPSDNPTVLPTTSPTNLPTVTESSAPSVAASGSPSLTPTTAKPTQSPSDSPTTAEPSALPTSLPPTMAPVSASPPLSDVLPARVTDAPTSEVLPTRITDEPTSEVLPTRVTDEPTSEVVPVLEDGISPSPVPVPTSDVSATQESMVGVDSKKSQGAVASDTSEAKGNDAASSALPDIEDGNINANLSAGDTTEEVGTSGGNDGSVDTNGGEGSAEGGNTSDESPSGGESDSDREGKDSSVTIGNGSINEDTADGAVDVKGDSTPSELVDGDGIGEEDEEALDDELDTVGEAESPSGGDAESAEAAGDTGIDTNGDGNTIAPVGSDSAKELSDDESHIVELDSDSNARGDVDIVLSDDGSGIADPPGDPEIVVAPEDLVGVPLTPFGIELNSEQPVDEDELSRVTSDFLHLYFKDELPRMGYPHYHGVDLSIINEDSRRRKLNLRARQLQDTTINEEFIMGGDTTFIGQPTPDPELLDNLRSAAFAGATSKADYLDALKKNSTDPGLKSTTNVIIHESGSGFSLTPTERISPSAYSDGDGNGRGFNSYIIAAMAAVSFIVIGSALFLYSRKRMRDGKEEDMMSLHSDEASDSVLLKNDLGCSDSVDSHDNAIKVPSELDIQPVPISLIRDSKTLERAMIRASRNRSVIEKANERVERKSIFMNEDHEEDSKTITFAEIIANSVSRSPRVSSHLPQEPLDNTASPPSSVADLDTKSTDSLKGLTIDFNDGKEGRIGTSPDPPVSGEANSGGRSTEDRCVELDSCCIVEGENSSCTTVHSATSGLASQALAIVACSPSRHRFSVCGDDDDFSYHEGPATDNSMAKPTPGVPSIELPPAPISMTVEKISPNQQQIINALAEGNPSTPFSLITYSVHNGDEETFHQNTRLPFGVSSCMPFGVSSSIDRALLESSSAESLSAESPSEEGQELALLDSPATPRLGISASPNISIVANERSPVHRLGIAAPPNVSLDP